MHLNETEQEMILSALDRGEQFYKGLFDSVSPPLNGLLTTAKMHRKLRKKLAKAWTPTI